MLVSRYLNLLARANQPEEILAITFTKKAAAEMRHRILQALASGSPETQLVRQQNAARGWQLLQNSHRLRVLTIDAFALDLVQRAPGLQTADRLQILTHPDEYYQLAANNLLLDLIDDSPTAPLIAEFLKQLDNNGDEAVRLVSNMLSRREQWLDVAHYVAMRAGDDTPSSAAGSPLAELLTQAVKHLHEQFSAELAERFSGHDWQMLQFSRDAMDAGTPESFAHLLTGQGKLRKRITKREGVTDKAVKDQLTAWLSELEERNLETLLVTLNNLPKATDINDVALLTCCCTVLSMAAARLDSLMQQRGVTDFNGLLIKARQALTGDDGPTDLALLLEHRIKHVLVDEFQDTSRAQAEFFALLTAGWDAQDDHTWFAVGDPMQSIYRFRDADVAVFTQTRDEGISGIPLEPLELQVNFRSHPSVVQWCNEIFSQLLAAQDRPEMGQIRHAAAVPNPFDQQGEVSLQDANQPAIACQAYESDAEELQAVLDRIQHLRKTQPDTSIAVLCRARTHVAPLLAALEHSGLPNTAIDMMPLADSLIVRDLMSMYATLLEPHDKLAWMSVLRSPMFGIPLPQLTMLAESSKSDSATLDAHLTLLGDPGERLQKAWLWARSQLYERPLREVIEGYWLRCGGVDAYTEELLNQAMMWFRTLESLGTLAYNPEQVQAAIAELYEQRNSSVPVEQTVQVLTIHKSKGLEFDHVLIPHLHKGGNSDDTKLLHWRPARGGILMGFRGDALHKWLNYEEKVRSANEDSRLLYVACTRAKQSLWTSFVQIPGKVARNMAAHLSQFANQIESQKASSVPAPQGLQTALFDEAEMQRLPATYTWELPRVAPHSSGSGITPQPDTDPLAGRVEIAVGILTHRIFAWGCEFSDTTRVEQWLAQIKRLSRDLDVGPDDLENVQQLAASHVARTLADPEGQRILSATEQAFCELPLSGVNAEGQVQHIVLDRTFVEDGVRWIVDYKTAVPKSNESTADFELAQLSRYRPQLLTYARIAQATWPDYPVKTGLYLTATPTLLPLADIP